MVKQKYKAHFEQFTNNQIVKIAVYFWAETRTDLVQQIYKKASEESWKVKGYQVVDRVKVEVPNV